MLQIVSPVSRWRASLRLAVAATVLVQQVAWAAEVSSADQVISRHLEALGGTERLQAIHTLRRSGRIVAPGAAVETEYTETRTRPSSIQRDQSVQGLHEITAFDGHDAWKVRPSLKGSEEREPASAVDACTLRFAADIDSPLIDYRSKGHSVEYLGLEDLDGASAYKLRVHLAWGDEATYWIDPDSWMILRERDRTASQDVGEATDADFSDYEQVEGVWVPMSEERGPEGSDASLKQRIVYDRVEVNAQPGRTPAPAALATKGAAGASGSSSRGLADSAVISGLGARNIGSATMSGRIAAIAGRAEADGRVTLFVGAASGGVWRSFNGGTTFKPVFDRQPVQSIGAIALDPSNPNVVWIGTGESWMRNSVSAGNGIYRSADLGETWSPVGLPEAEHVNRLIVHPKDGNIVYACVPGKLWSDSADRGLYKTTDAGRSWALVLRGSNLSTGCSGLTMDPRNPDRLFAGLWDFRRQGWTFRSGGESSQAHSGSGLFLTEDGGKTWRRLDASSAKGLPPAPWGRLDVAVAPSNPEIVYALIESARSAIFRSDDGGRTWEERDHGRDMAERPFYHSHLVIDPANPERVFKPSSFLAISEDGGRSFSGGGGIHADDHDVWVNPKNTQHLVTGDDAGVWTSHDGGEKWLRSDNLPVSQFYHVSVDDQDPYQVYGGLQDTGVWIGDSAYPGGITNNRWQFIFNGDGSWAFSDPADANFAYAVAQGGLVGRTNRHTLEQRSIQPQAGFKEKLRYNWGTPIALSLHEKGKLYIGAQYLFVTRDQGQSWTRISPDLTTNDPAKQKQELSGGITHDSSGAENHTTIYSIAESPRDGDVIWVGTDDGNLQLTRNGGKVWNNVVSHVPGLPRSSWVSWVEPGRHADGVAYAAFDRHTFGDLTPHVYRTRDFGVTWERIVAPSAGVRGYVHVVREDPVNPHILYVGTEFGLWISLDDGANWAEFRGGHFPSVAVRDLAFQERDQDLVIGTHGRGIWIIDDLTPLRQLTPELLSQEVVLLDSRPVQQRSKGNNLGNGGNGRNQNEGDGRWTGENPADGAVINYYQGTRSVFGRTTLQILDASGNVIDTLAPGRRRGINRVVWSMRLKPPRVPAAANSFLFNAFQSPRVPPGTYRVRLDQGGKVYEQALVVGLDRRATFSVADRQLQYEAVMRAYALFGHMSDFVDRLNGLKTLAGERRERLEAGRDISARGQTATPRSAAPLLEDFEEHVEGLRKRVVTTMECVACPPPGQVRLRENLDLVYGELLSYEGRPADYQIERVGVIERELAEVERDAVVLEVNELPKVNRALKRAALPLISAADAQGAGARLAALGALERAVNPSVAEDDD